MRANTNRVERAERGDPTLRVLGEATPCASARLELVGADLGGGECRHLLGGAARTFHVEQASLPVGDANIGRAEGEFGVLTAGYAVSTEGRRIMSAVALDAALETFIDRSAIVRPETLRDQAVHVQLLEACVHHADERLRSVAKRKRFAPGFGADLGLVSAYENGVWLAQRGPGHAILVRNGESTRLLDGPEVDEAFHELDDATRVRIAGIELQPRDVLVLGIGLSAAELEDAMVRRNVETYLDRETDLSGLLLALTDIAHAAGATDGSLLAIAFQ